MINIRAIKRQFFSMVTHVSGNKDLSHKRFLQSTILFGTLSQTRAYDRSFRLKSVLKRHVQLGLIDLLIARAHGKVHSFSKNW